MIIDYHMHLRDEHEELAHRASAVEPFVTAARLAGVDEIGFTEHVYYFEQTRRLWTVPYHLERCGHDLDDYVTAVSDAKARGLPVKLGLEVDYEPGREDETIAFLEPYTWDFLLGSVHFVDGLAVDGGPPRLIDAVGVEGAWHRYFDVLADAARSGVFDVLSHPDLVKIFGDRVPTFDYGPVADAIAEGGVAVEVSTAGLRKPVGELYPDGAFLRACHDRAVPITTASDAHVPQLVGRDFDLARALLESVGYETVTVFDRRRPSQVAVG